MSAFSSHAQGLLLKVVHVQSQLILGLAVYTVLLLKFRQRFQLYRKREAEKFSGFIIDELCKPAESRASEIQPRRFSNRFEKTVIQETLLEQIKLVSGPERELLRRYYEVYGFRDEDVKRVESRRWWVRLRALTNLGNLHRDELAPLFNRYMHDAQPIVSISATLALSGLAHECNGKDFLERLPVLILGRKDVLFGIVMNCAAIHGSEILAPPIHENRDPRLAESCIHALAEIKDSSSIALLVEKLGPGLSHELTTEILMAVGSAGDPQVLSHVRPYLQHREASVRAAAVRCVLALGDKESKVAIKLLRKDPSIEVRRVIQLSKLAGKKAA